MNDIQKLNAQTQCGIVLCKKAIEFCRVHEECTPVGYLKACTFAVKTPKLTFLQRVQLFSKEGNSQ